MRAKIVFEGHHEMFVTKDDETFEEFSHRIGSAAPAGMLIFDDVAVPYNRVLHILKLED